MKWFRFYSEVIDDPKVQSLSPELFKFWVNILCLANRQERRGTLPPLEKIAFDLRMRLDHVKRFTTALQASDLLIKDVSNPLEEVLKPHGWDTRQHDSDDVSKRVRRHRERICGELGSSESPRNGQECNVTCNVTSGVSASARDRFQITEVRNNPLPPSFDDRIGSGPIPLQAHSDPLPEIPPAAVSPDSRVTALTTPAPPPPAENTPVEIARVAAKAERMFPCQDYGPKVHEISGHVPMGHLDYALDEMHAAGKSDWRYLAGILRRLKTDGLPPPKVTPKMPPVKPREVLPMYMQPLQIDERSRQKYANLRRPDKEPATGS